MQLELKLLRIDGGTQPREQIDEATVADYAEHLREGSTFPPVVAFFDGCVYWLADGFHRYHAHRRACRDTIEADVSEGGLREAVLYSVGANADHGLRRTNADKRKAVTTMLTAEIVTKNDEGNAWSDREIARRCKVHPDTVSKYRASLSEIDSEKSSVHSSQRTYVTKHGTPAVMKTANIGKRKGRKKTGGIAKDAHRPRRPHSEDGPVPMRTISLPLNNPRQAARSMISVYGEVYVREMFEELQHVLKGEIQ